MFAHDFAPTQASFGKAARAQSIRPSHDSAGEQEQETSVSPARFSSSLRNLLLSPAAGHDQRNFGRAGGTRHVGAPPLPMQAKLEVGAVDDPLEREADRIAAQVTRAPVSEPASDRDGFRIARTAKTNASGQAASLRRECACGGTCANCKAGRQDEERGDKERGINERGDAERGAEEHGDDEHETAHVLMRSSSASGASSAAPAIVHEVLSEPGKPLDASTRAFFEPRFGWDFSQVRVHTDARAAASAKAVAARAYTVGNHIVFRNDEFNRSGVEGRTLLAHELAHVVQQDASPSAGFAERGAATPSPSTVLRRQPGGQPDEPLNDALAQQGLSDLLDELFDKIREQRDAGRVDRAESEAKVSPFFVQEDPQVQRMEQQIAAGRTQVPARLAKLRESLRAVGKEALRESDNLDQLRARIAFVEQMNSFVPALLRDTEKYEALLKERKRGEEDYADTMIFFDGIRKQIEVTKRFLPERAAYLTQRSHSLEKEAASAAGKAKVGTDDQASADQLTLLRTVIEASPTLRPYLKEQRAAGSQPTDLRDARKFVIHSSDSDLQDAVRKAGIEPAEQGKKIGGFYDRQTDTIHLPPDAKFGTALHESMHKYSKLLLKGACSQFLSEGLTQYFADIALADQGLPKFTGHVYQDQLKCATRFVNAFHLEEVASAYFLGTAGLGTGKLHQFLLSRQCPKFCEPEQGD